MSALARKAGPAGADPLINQGVALAEQGRLEEAVAKLRAASLAWPDSAKAHLNLGVALVKEGQFDGARRQFEEVLRLEPDNQLARNALSQISGQRP